MTESVDTNVLLRAAIDVGDGQTIAARALLASNDRTFVVHLLVFAEFVFVLTTHYGMSRVQAATLVRWVMGIESVDCPRDLIEASIDLFQTHPKLSFEDCLLAEQARNENAVPLWTFDRKLANQHPVAQLVPIPESLNDGAAS